MFRTEKTNARTPGVNPGDPPTVLAGEQRVSGVELGASGRLTERWTVFGGYAFMDSEIAASNTPAEIDNALALTPEHTFSLWTTFELPWDVSLGGGAQYMDAVFRNATNTAVVPSYWLINALASYEVNQHLTLRLNAEQPRPTSSYVDRVGGGHYIPGAAPLGAGLERESGSEPMLLQIPDVLHARAGGAARGRSLARAEWVDGRVTAGHQSARAKDNLQIPEGSSGRARARRADPPGASSAIRCSSRRRCRCASFRRSSTATRAASRSATTSTTRSAR